jgi:hypothetical protein
MLLLLPAAVTLLAVSYILFSYLPYYFNLNMEAKLSSETPSLTVSVKPGNGSKIVIRNAAV